MKPVLIIGAGPVGMTMASELVRYGVPVRIVDKAAQRTDKSKALVLWSRTLELLDRGGGAAPFVDAGFKAQAVNFIAGDKVIGRVSMESVQTPYPYGLMLPQSETERLLEERLRDLGVDVERQGGARLHSRAVPTASKRCCGMPMAHEEVVSADWLLGCDGAHSAVRHGLGAPFAGETLNSDWMLADVHMTGYPYPDTEASVYWHRDGVFVIFPISPGRYRVIARLASRRGRASANADAGAGSGDHRSAGAKRIKGLRSDLARGFQDQRPQGRELSLGTRFLRGRCGARAQPRRRAGYEHRDAGRVQPGLEAGTGCPQDV